MARGFKDETGKFHPTERRLAQTRANPRLHDKTLQVGIQGSQIANLIKKQASEFAVKRTKEALERIEGAKERQARELEIRRDFEKRLISSFKRARKLQIKNPVLLKNQIFIDVNELKDTPENVRFVEKILNDFLKREKTKDKAIKKAKTDEQKIAIEQAFNDAERLEEDDVKKQLLRGETKLKKKQQEELDRLKSKEKAKSKSEEEIGDKAVKDFQKKEKETKKKEDEVAEKEEEEQKKVDEIKKAKEPVVTFANLEEQQKAEDKAEKEQQASMDELLEIQNETLEVQEELEELQKDTEKEREIAESIPSMVQESDLEESIESLKESSTQETDVGFPQEIIA